MVGRLLSYVLAGAGMVAAAGWLAFLLWKSQQFAVGVSADHFALRLTITLLMIGGVLGAGMFLLRR